MDRCARRFPALNDRRSSRRILELGLVCSIVGGFSLAPFTAPGAASTPSLTAAIANAGAGRLEPQAQLPTLWIRLSGCEAASVGGACAGLPDLVVELDDAPGQAAAHTIHLQVGDRETECAGQSCAMALEETSLEGVDAEFWVEPADAQRPTVYTATLRVIPAEGPSGDNSPWFVQVLSSQWAGEAVDSCAVAWDTFPPLGLPPDWLATPEEPMTLASEVTYHHLAAELINRGGVQASACPDGGLIDLGTPSACGVETAMPTVLEWQNRFDPAILDAARAAGIPAGLLKRLIAEESQFWPGTVPERGEYGLGHLTEAGADNALLWNPSLYSDVCRTVVGEAYCGKGYSQQSGDRRAMLRGALIAAADADCAECDLGVDLEAATAGISTTAQALRAYCSQTGRMVANTTGDDPGRTTTYEDLWRLTLAGYAAGPGCLADAMRQAWRSGRVLTWESVSSRLSTQCTGAKDYAEHISR